MIQSKQVLHFFLPVTVCLLMIAPLFLWAAQFHTEDVTLEEWSVRTDPLQYKYQDIHLMGELKKGDYAKFMVELSTAFAEAKIRGAPVRVQLTSPGGNVIEAMKIGETVRQLRLSTIANDCSSACFFVLVAGVHRQIMFPGNIHLHRPYIEPSSFSAFGDADAEMAYRDVEQLVRTYFAQMDVPESLVDEMMRIPSNKSVKLVSGDFVASVGLSAPFYEERILATCVRLSPQERIDEGVAGMYADPENRLNMSAGYISHIRQMRVKEHACLQELLYRDQQEAYSTLEKIR